MKTEMATIVFLPSFDAKDANAWEEYCKLMEHLFTANDTDNEDLLLSLVGVQIYLISPSPKVLSLKKVLKSPKKPGEEGQLYPQIMAQIFNFISFIFISF